MKKKEEKRDISESEVLIYGAYAQVAYSLQHSNHTQLTYKGVTLTWMIATYIGIGYSPSSLEVNLPLNPLLIVATICLVSLLVVSAIWYLDLVVEEKKIASAVLNGLALEKKYSRLLPKAYHNVVEMNYLLGYVSMKSIYYIAFASILLLTICSSVAAYLFIEGYKFWWVIPFVILIIIPSLFILSNWMTNRTDPYPILKNRHKRKREHGHK